MGARFVETDSAFALSEIFSISQGERCSRVERRPVGSIGAGMEAET
jgi:hypothetical protein